MFNFLQDSMDDPRMRAALGGLPGIQQTQGGGLMGGAPLAPAHMPQLAAPTGDQPPPSLWQRIKAGLSGAANGMMPAPAGLGGLLSNDDIHHARKMAMLQMGLSLMGNARGQGGHNAPGLGQALQQGVQTGQQAYGEGIGQIVQGIGAGAQLRQQQRVLAGRQRISEQYGPQPTDSPTQRADKLRSMYQAFMANGDFEGAKAMEHSAPELFKPETDRPYQHIDQGDKVVIVDPRDPKRVLATYPKSKMPLSDEAKASLEASLGLRRESLDAREEQQRSGREARMVSQYDQNTKAMQQQATALQSLYEMRAGALKGDPVSQQTALQDFIRLVLPGQVVAQGELHSYAGQLGLGDRVALEMEKLDHGQPLGEKTMRSIFKHVDELAKAARSRATYYRSAFQKRGEKYAIDPEAFIDHFGFMDAPGYEPTSDAPAPGSSASIRQFEKKP